MLVEKTNTTTSFVELAGLVEADDMTVLRLTDCTIKGDEDDAFRLSRALRGHPSLEEVVMKNIKLDNGMTLDSTIEMVLVSSQNLKVLMLDAVPVNAKSIATAAYCETLDILSLPNNGFNDMDAQLVADAIASSKSITSVDLSGNRITSCKSLTFCLEKNSVIQNIALSGNSISGAETTKLESTLKLRAAIAA